MKEIWKTTKQSKYYMVSNYGRVRSVDKVIRFWHKGKKDWAERLVKGRILKLTPKSNGYVRVCIQHEGFKKHIFVHRLVAEAFIPNPDNKPIPHHGDHNRSNNRYDNLEWQTYEFNNKEAWESGNQQINSGNFKKGQPSVSRKLVKCSNGLIFESSYDAAEWINKTQFNNTHNIKSIAANIRNQIYGSRATAYKFTWKHIT
jgi:hypothetical protein